VRRLVLQAYLACRPHPCEDRIYAGGVQSVRGTTGAGDGDNRRDQHLMFVGLRMGVTLPTALRSSDALASLRPPLRVYPRRGHRFPGADS
jgi:hypothetical protein